MALDVFLFATGLAGTAAPAGPAVYEVLAAPDALTALPFTIDGRGTVEASEAVAYRAPGAYFETAFRGDRLYFKVGPGDVTMRIIVDGHAMAALVKPTPGFYEVDALPSAPHHVRIETEMERDAGSGEFGGFYLMSGEAALR